MRELLLEHRNLVEAVVARFLWDRCGWEDVIHNVFVKVVTSIGDFKGKCRFTTWLYRISVNECIEANRKQARQAKYIDGDTFITDIFPDLNAPDCLTIAIQNEIRSTVREIVANLPEGMREAFELFYNRQYTGTEAAQELNITEQAFFVRLNAARSRLKEELKNRGILSC